MVHVQMGWLFRATFPLAHVVSVNPRPASVSLGVHGWSGRYLVNGAWSPLATIRIGPEARAFMLGVPVKLRELIVSVDDPGVLRSELASAHVL
jgi:hypothetical protein